MAEPSTPLPNGEHDVSAQILQPIPPPPPSAMETANPDVEMQEAQPAEAPLSVPPPTETPVATTTEAPIPQIAEAAPLPPPMNPSAEQSSTTPNASGSVAPAVSRSAESPRPNQPPPAAAATIPAQPLPHGSPTRVYLNQNVTPYLLEGMKQLAMEEPEKPLQWLASFLADKSKEVEGA